MSLLKSIRFIVLALLFCLMLLPNAFAGQEKVSGHVKEGFRILSLTDTDTLQTFTVFRGDYIKFDLPETVENPSVVFPPSTESKALTRDLTAAPYFKMKKTGTRSFIIGSLKGQIHIIEYEQERYQAINAKKARKLIQDESPFILDVRTPGEYQAGHIEDSNLLPVQVLHQYIEKLIPFKDKPILIYCATGNRSTVASKILIDNGFNHIINMRYGIREWAQNGYKIVR